PRPGPPLLVGLPRLPRPVRAREGLRAARRAVDRDAVERRLRGRARAVHRRDRRLSPTGRLLRHEKRLPAEGQGARRPDRRLRPRPEPVRRGAARRRRRGRGRGRGRRLTFGRAYVAVDRRPTRRRTKMADEALFVGWGPVVRGREQVALEIFQETLEFWGRAQ